MIKEEKFHENFGLFCILFFEGVLSWKTKIQLYTFRSWKRYCFWAASSVWKEALSASLSGNFLQVTGDTLFLSALCGSTPPVHSCLAGYAL